MTVAAEFEIELSRHGENCLRLGRIAQHLFTLRDRTKKIKLPRINALIQFCF